MTILTEQYGKAFSDNCLLDPDSWFEDDTPLEQFELLDNLVVSSDVAESMLLSGETYWSHLGWWKDVYQTLKTWAQDGQLLKVQMIAQWLSQTLPDTPLDVDCSILLHQLASGDFCRTFKGMSCEWPKKPEFYRKRLLWAIADFASDTEMNLVASVKAQLLYK